MTLSGSTLAGYYPITTSWTILQNKTIDCIPPPISHFYYEGIPAYVFLPFHLFLCTSLTVFRSHLQRRVVNIHILNVVVANTVACLWRCVQYSVDFELRNHSHEELQTWGPVLDGWWLFSISMSMTLLLGSMGAIVLAIMAMRNTVFHVHRTVAGFGVYQQRDEDSLAVQHSNKIKQWSSKNPTKLALGLILINWFVAFSFLTTSLLLPDCLHKCICHYGFLLKNEQFGCNIIINSTCSNKDPPIHDYAVIFSIVIWTLLVASLVVILIRFGIDYKNFRMGVTTATTMQSPRIQSLSRHLSSREDTVVVQNASGSCSDSSSSVVVEGPQRSLILQSLKRKVVSLVLVSFLVMVGTGFREIPDLLEFFWSRLTDKANAFHAINPMSSLTEIISSAVLCWAARGTQAALRSAFGAIARLLHCVPV